MKLSNQISRVFSILIVILNMIQGQKIVHMNGTYDLDGDALLEFIALELDPTHAVFPSTVRYYEIDADGYQTLVWEFTPPDALDGHFVDAQIGDLDGDGAPELVLVMNLSRFGDNATPHVFVATYSWDGSNFSEIPTSAVKISFLPLPIACSTFLTDPTKFLKPVGSTDAD